MRQADLHARSRAYQAFVFDMDGVVTDTATVHAAVWKTVLDEVLTPIGGSDQPPFDPVSDYRSPYIDGRTCEDGIRCFWQLAASNCPRVAEKTVRTA